MENSRDQPGSGRHALSTTVGYLLFFILGLLEGLFGSFQYNRVPVPLVSIALAVLIFATCLLAGWGWRTFGAGILPALGWIAASFILAMPRPNGSIIITATLAGEWYLYGGAAAALAGAVTAVLAWASERIRHS